MARQNDRTDLARRQFVKAVLAGVGLAVTGLWQRVRAADASIWPKDAFTQKSEADAIKAVYGKEPTVSDQVKLDAPEIAENGAVVPISVSTPIANVTSIAILVSENPYPLAALYKIPPGTSAMVSNRLKMAKTSRVVALVEADGKILSASKEVKVTVGGCGG
jgi:sulfur-oxidizing protein SoxY